MTDSNSRKSRAISATDRISLTEFTAYTGVSHGLEPLLETSAIYIIPYGGHLSRPWPPAFSIYSDKQKRYFVENHRHHRMFYVIEVAEEPSCLPRAFRPYLLKFFDPWGQIVFVVQRRKTKALSCWGTDIYGNDISVVLRTSDELLGEVKQKFSLCLSTRFEIKGPSGITEFVVDGRVKGNYCSWPPPNYVDIDLRILDGNDRKKILQGFEVIKDKQEPELNDFGMRLPLELDYKMKAVLLGFLMNIYVTYYEGGRLLKEAEESGNWRYFYPARKGCTGWRICLFCSFTIFLLIIIAAVVGFILFYSVIAKAL